MNLTNETIQQTYGNLLTIGTTAGTPTQGTLQNGAGQNVSNLTLDELEVNKLIQTQATIAASGTSLSSATLLTAGVNLVTSADANNIAVKLPQSQLGLIINVVNTSTRDIEVYPYSATDSVLGLPDGDPFIVSADNKMYQFVCVQNPNVGVWTVISPYNGQSARKSVTLELTANSSDPSVGSAMAVTVDNLANNDPQGFIFRTTNSNAVGLDMTAFKGYNEIRCVGYDIKTNVPTGNLTQTASQQPYNLMGGLTLSQWQTIDFQIAVGGWDKTSIPNPSSYIDTVWSNRRIAYYDFSNTYSLNVQVGFDPLRSLPDMYVPQVGDPAYGITTSTYFQSDTGPTISGLDNWINVWDDYSRAALAFNFILKYGNGSNPASGFPAGFELKYKITLEFEMR